MDKELKRFLLKAKKELDLAVMDGNINDINSAAEKIYRISRSLWMLGTENINNIE